MTAIAPNVQHLVPALHAEEASHQDVAVASPTVTAVFQEHVRPSAHWDELAWWTKQLGRPLDAA